jgi:hypothetical protein
MENIVRFHGLPEIFEEKQNLPAFNPKDACNEDIAEIAEINAVYAAKEEAELAAVIAESLSLTDDKAAKRDYLAEAPDADEDAIELLRAAFGDGY